MNKTRFLLSMFVIGFSTASYCQESDQISNQESYQPSNNSVGVGFGLPFGGLGINYEHQINDYAAVLAGLGWMPDNIGVNLGARFYYPSRESKFRGRVTALYGTNTLIDNGYSRDYETETGLSLGAGFNWRFTENWGIDADIIAVSTNLPDGYQRKGSSVGFSLGIRRNF